MDANFSEAHSCKLYFSVLCARVIFYCIGHLSYVLLYWTLIDTILLINTEGITVPSLK